MTRHDRAIAHMCLAPFARVEAFDPRPRDLLAAYRAAVDVMRGRVRPPAVTRPDAT